MTVYRTIDKLLISFNSLYSCSSLCDTQLAE